MLKKFRPTTPTLRHTVLSAGTGLTRKKHLIKKNGKVVGESTRAPKPEKTLCVSLKKTGGRNNLGRITTRHRGGGHKRSYRIIDFKRDKYDVEAVVDSIQYDPNRTAYIALLVYSDGEKRYIIAPKSLKEGDTVISYGEGNGSAEVMTEGHSMLLSEMRIGAKIHNVELNPGRGGVFLRSAGASGVLAGRDGKHAIVKLATGEVRRIPLKCRATFGEVSNSVHSLKKLGKAGRKRWMGVRPTVRGMAMNPVDHPHGGGEGRGKGNIPQSPTGVFAKGFKTRSKKKSNKHIVQKRKTKRKG